MSRGTQRRVRKERYFETGASAIQRVLYFDEAPHRRSLYVCPLCAAPHEIRSLKAGLLSEEHVPPASLGGRAITLTCKACNSGAGTMLDKHASERKKTDELVSLQAGTGTVVLPGGVRGQLTIGAAGGAHLSIRQDRNDPAVFAGFRAVAPPAGAYEVHDLTFLQFGVARKYDDWKANLSLLRAAYLAAFTQFGYRAAFSASYEPVRRQLCDIDSGVIERLVTGETLQQWANQSGFAEGHIEGLGRTLVVLFGTRWVGLPGTTSDVGWWDRAAALGPKELMQMRNLQTLPRYPVHELDFAELPEEGILVPFELSESKGPA